MYVGKTVSCLSQRVNGHRSKFYEILRPFENDRSLSFQSSDHSFDDENILGAHLFSVHNLKEKKEFNRCFCFDILCCTSPENLKIKKSEQFYNDKLKSLYPFGLNNENSISI